MRIPSVVFNLALATLGLLAPRVALAEVRLNPLFANNAVLQRDAEVPVARRATAVRYGWADLPKVNLFNQAGLPASNFRTDDWPL